MASPLDSFLFKTESQPNAYRSLANDGSLTPDEIAERRRKMLAAANATPTFQAYSGIATNLFGTNVQ